MATLARARPLDDLCRLEGFEIEIVNKKGKPVEIGKEGASDSFNRKADGNMTVADWKAKRFHTVCPQFDCRVFCGDGRKAYGNTKLRTVRGSY